MILLTENLMNAENFLRLLKGSFGTGRESDPRIRRFYTADEARRLLTDAGLETRFLLRLVAGNLNVPEEDRRILETVRALPGVAIGEDFATIRYIFTAGFRQREM